jgi:hypothetical protein
LLPFATPLSYLLLALAFTTTGVAAHAVLDRWHC